MPQDDVVRIRVDKQSVGIMGLKTAMEEMAEDYGDRPDDAAEILEELLKRLSKKNYIPEKRQGRSYAKAFLT